MHDATDHDRPATAFERALANFAAEREMYKREQEQNRREDDQAEFRWLMYRVGRVTSPFPQHGD